MRPTHRLTLVVPALALLAACGDDAGTPADAGNTDDTTADTTADVTADGSADAAADATADSTPDAAADAAADAETDSAPDTSSDAEADAEPDAEADAGTDAEPDVAPDASDDAEADTGTDAEPDAGADAADDTDGGTLAPGETCEDAPSLAAASTPLATPGTYTHSVTATAGTANDYNPLNTSGLEPGCSIVYDSLGNETVWAVTLQPGQTIALRVTASPSSAIPSLYFLDSCPGATWPDNDGSTMCGNNEYRTEGFCGAVPFCDPLVWTYTWPAAIGGAPTSTKQLWLVVDEVVGTAMTDYTLEWAVTGP